jgi:hypothetical protein
MFESLFLICAASVNQGIIPDSCFMFKDNSFFNTIESCEIENEHIVNEVSDGVLTPNVFEIYRKSGVFAELLYVEGKCIAIGNLI